MANRCNCTLSIQRLDWWSLTAEEIWAFIRKEDSPEKQWLMCKVNWENYYFSYQFVVPVKQDENRWNNNINARWVKRDAAYEADIYLEEKDMTIYFFTPRSPPDKWCQAVCKKFPELCIKLEYDEPGCGFQGEMWRDENWELFDNYREWDAYLHECYWCWFNLKDSEYREDAEDFLCDECYKTFLNHNSKKKWGK